jgi:alpha-galactosidase
MGWMSWNAFGRDLSAEAVMAVAEAMLRNRLVDAGYEYVCLDDHWHGRRRADGRLRPDPGRFPDGIAALADALHDRGLKLGIYTCAGPLTCGGEAGSEGFEELDAKTFAEWGVDYVKDDYCHAPPERDAAVERYRRMGEALLATRRDIVLAVCEWGDRAPWEWGRSVGASLWRIGPDIQDRWAGPGGILEVADRAESLAGWAGPGGWNDPDMLVVGLRGRSRAGAAGTAGCSDVEYRTQMTLWSMLAAPLLASSDLRSADSATIDILGAPGVVAIDQDALGEASRRRATVGSVDIWDRPLEGGGRAVAIVNRADMPEPVRIAWAAEHGAAPDVEDAWAGRPISNGPVETVLEPHASLLFRVGSGDVQVPEVSVPR